jgi:hypothetical protein
LFASLVLLMAAAKRSLRRPALVVGT